MDTQEAIRFVASFRSSETGLVGYQLSLTQVKARNDKLNEITYILAQGKLYNKMWNWFKDSNGSLIIMYPSHKETVRELMDKAEVKFLGSKPKTKHQRLNEVIDRLGIYMQVGKMSEIIESLVKLRDEEEDA